MTGNCWDVTKHLNLQNSDAFENGVVFTNETVDWLIPSSKSLWSSLSCTLSSAHFLSLCQCASAQKKVPLPLQERALGEGPTWDIPLLCSEEASRARYLDFWLWTPPQSQWLPCRGKSCGSTWRCMQKGSAKGKRQKITSEHFHPSHFVCSIHA